MRPYKVDASQLLVVDGMVLHSCRPFEVYEAMPRNDSLKSSTSTKMGENEQFEEFLLVETISKAITDSGSSQYQTVYELMLRLRTLGERRNASHPGLITHCVKPKQLCRSTRRSLFLSEFAPFEFNASP